LALSNITISVPRHFLGREDDLAEIDVALKLDEGRVAVTTLRGMRGVGKTVLAAAYAERHKADYRATWWIRAETPDTIRADLVSLGVRLGWVSADEREEPALEKVRERLRDEGEGLLLIYDNAKDAPSLSPYIPGAGATRALVTSNAHAWRGVATLVEIGVWAKKVGADYLIVRTGRDKERPAAEALSETLGGLPLAHEQAGAYCEQTGASFSDYRKRFEGAAARVLDATKYAPEEYHGGLTAAKAFALAINEADKLHPAAEPLITFASLLAPEPIPLFLFSILQESPSPLWRLLLRFQRLLYGTSVVPSMLSPEDVEGAVAALQTYALIDRETIYDERDPSMETQTIRLHRLVREVAVARMHRVFARWIALPALIKVMATAYPPRVYEDPSAWPRARQFDALAAGLLSVDIPVSKGTTAAVRILCTGLGKYRQAALAAYSEARPLLERALVLTEKALGPEHLDTAASLNDLALLFWEQGHPEDARPLHERALAIREKALLPEHLDTAVSLNNLGLDLHAQGDLVGARSRLERALAIRERALGPEDPITAIYLDNLALVLSDQGDLLSARMLNDRAVAILEKTWGLEHPDTNVAVANQSRLRLAGGVPAEALSLAERALAGHERLLGADHRRTRDSAGNAANALDALGRADEAAAVRARYGTNR
jgi:tetratricopeptide (TPR) repeat protein